MQKSNKLLGVVLAVICILTAGSVTLSALAFNSQNKVVSSVEKLTQQIQAKDEEEENNKENDVTIADRYVIRSTEYITDAYKAGDTSSLSDEDKETLDMAQKVLDEYITDDMTDFDKELAIYDYLTTKLQSSKGALSLLSTGSGEYDNPHDVLKYKGAVCVGYATTFRFFMQMMGIECKVVHDTGLGHSWDLVHLDDGWYHTDCYMGANSSDYSNFNMDDTLCSNSHDWDRTAFPAATGKKYNYALTKCTKIKNIYAIPEWLLTQIDNGENAMSCTFEEPITDENASSAQYITSQLESMVSADDITVSFNWTTNENGDYVLCAYAYNYNGESVPDDIEPDEMTKIDNKINKALEKHSFYENHSGYSEDFGGGK